MSVSRVLVLSAILLLAATAAQAETPSSLGTLGFKLRVAPVSAPGDPAAADWFLVGGNWRILGYGKDFGTSAWSPDGDGISKHTSEVRASIGRFRKAGLRRLRVFLLNDGRGFFDEKTRVIGYNATFRRDVRTLLDLAAEAGIGVEFALLDFLVAKPGAWVSGVYIGGGGAVFTEPAVRAAFIRDFLEPFLTEFGAHRGLVALDLVNESEWMVSRFDGGRKLPGMGDLKGASAIPKAALHAYARACIAAIRKIAPRLFVTMGVSCPDVDLVKALPLDYVAVHWYPWMGDLRKCLGNLPKDRPYILEEYPTGSKAAPVADFLAAAKESGCFGALLWNLAPGCDDQTLEAGRLETVLSDIAAWLAGRPGSVAIAASGSPGGTLSRGTRVKNPGGTLEASEAEPAGSGRIAIVDPASGQALAVVAVTTHPKYKDAKNDVKGLAWSADGARLAVLYHHDGAGHVSLVDVKAGCETAVIPVSGMPHAIAFASNGRSLSVDGMRVSIP